MKIAELVGTITAEFVKKLYQEDLAEAARVKAGGCPKCHSELHVANYPRKPRGHGAEEPGMSCRLSFCCGTCRKRVTPKSVRFLGRKVYLGQSVALASVLRWQEVKVTKVCGVLGMSAETLRRWKCWWAGPVQRSKWWSAVRAQIMPRLEGEHFIGELFGRLEVQAQSAEAAIRKLLIIVSPLTVPAAYPS